ncbi:formimidoylglutamate deiminase [Pacificimonas flava]|nr:formimidoylglutamate deiminase [Pacificimonas flava]
MSVKGCIRLTEGWKNCRLSWSDDGRLSRIGTGNPGPQATDRIYVPAPANMHSHAFQRALAGLAEGRAAQESDFWSWREIMYKFLQFLGPEDMFRITCQLYVELVRAGYAHVCEFHYLHNDPDGRPYSNRSEMANAVIEAAKVAGIGLTLIPVLYRFGGFGGMPPEPGQRRFIMEEDAYFRLLNDLRVRGDREGFRVGAALHSLRAVSAKNVERFSDDLRCPVHIHIAEQEKEVAASLEWSGSRPVAWLLDHANVDERWTLVHATHMTDGEARRLAATGATVALCPTTEGNLGDGLFNAEPFIRAGGRFGIGSDSNVCTDPCEELRLFDYGQRLRTQRRLVLNTEDMPNAGAFLWLRAAEAGAAATGSPTGTLAEGMSADFIRLDEEHSSLSGKGGDTLLDSLIFAPGSGMVCETWVGGRQITANGHHPRQEAVASEFKKTTRSLKELI